MSEKTLNKIISLLQDNNITFKHEHHKTIAHSSIEASKIRKTDLNKGAKALIMETKSGKIIQAVVPADKRVSLKLLKKILDEKNIRLCHPDKVLEITDCVIGSVPPFGSLFDIEVFIDATLLELDLCVFSSGTLEDSIWISPKDLSSLNRAHVVNIIQET